jgi:hypothetical protein
MLIGHINLSRSMNGIGEHFVRLVEGLNRQGVRQHLLVANLSLARRVEILEQVRVGPVVRSGVMAYCLMPDVDVVHVHDPAGRAAGLVLRLTRSMPYILSRRETDAPGRTPVARSIIERSAGVICASEDAASSLVGFNVPVDTIADISHASDAEHDANRVAAEHLRIYRRATDSRRVPALLL